MGDGRLVAAPFLVKTYRLVDDPSSDNIISWGEHNNTFVVWKPKDLSTFLLPHYFNHNNFSSFVRQLNTYGFRKIARGRYEFGNDLFMKGHQHLLCKIQRRKLPLRSQGTNMSIQQEPPDAPIESLAKENEKLREKNIVLSSELDRLQSICKRILAFLHHNNSSHTNTDLVLQMMCQQNNPQHDRSPPKLFGVSLSRQTLHYE